jgi:hypothetical protein
MEYASGAAVRMASSSASAAVARRVCRSAMEVVRRRSSWPAREELALGQKLILVTAPSMAHRNES